MMNLKRVLCLVFSCIAIASAVFIFSNACFAVQTASAVSSELVDEAVYEFDLFDYFSFLVLGVALIGAYFTSKYRYNQKLINLMFAGCLVAVGSETVEYFNAGSASMGDVWTNIAGLVTGFIAVSFIVMLIRAVNAARKHKRMINKG